MAIPSGAVDYSGVPTQEAQGGGGTELGVRATPDAFGAQVGKATEDAGNKGFDVAMKQQGMINETLMTNADSQLAMKVGQIKGDYMSKTGFAAAAAFPQYQQQLEQARKEARANLPAGAAHGFDLLSEKTIASHIADGSSYMAGQLKQAQRDSGTDLQRVMLSGTLDPQIASDPARVDYHIGSAIHGLQMTMDENAPGMKTDPETGAVSFDEATPAGKAAKANYDAQVDNIITQAQVNRFTTLANGDLNGAHDLYQKEKTGLPPAAQVHMDAWFAPKLFNQKVDDGTTEVMAHAEQEHAKALYNPNAASSDSAIDTVLKNEGGLSPDGHAIYGIDKKSFPAQFAKAQEITNTGGAAAGEKYARDFYKTEFYDKKGIDSLPPETRNIVMDGVVNHYKGFSDKLITAAKDGATPQQLIDMRRQEYQRLVDTDPATYENSFQGWNNGLDGLEKTIGNAPDQKKPYGTNENGSPLTRADYYRTHSQDVLERADALAERDMPGDLAYKHAMRETVTNYMNKEIQNQAGQYKQDNENVSRAIMGQMTDGNPPLTRADLEAIPGMKSLLDKVQYQDPKFAEGIDTQIRKVAMRNSVTNSANGYDTIMRSLQAHGTPNAIDSEAHLSALLGRKDDVTGINVKDYQDAKKVIGASSDWKKFLSTNMTQITNANGNIDGQGQQRAVEWYNRINDAKKANEAKGDKGIPEDEFIKSIDDKLHPLAPSDPSTMQQISNWWRGNAAQVAQKIAVINPNGKKGFIPPEQLNDALKSGYKKVE